MKISVQDLSAMTLTELSNLNNLVISVIKAKRGLEGAQKATTLYVNQEVKVDHDGHKDSIFIIKKINKSKAVCHIKGNPLKEFNVPFSLIITE